MQRAARLCARRSCPFLLGFASTAVATATQHGGLTLKGKAKAGSLQMKMVMAGALGGSRGGPASIALPIFKYRMFARGLGCPGFVRYALLEQDDVCSDGLGS